MKYWVKYQVTGFDGIQWSGPYPEDDLMYQLKDISGYEGVYNAVIVSEDKRTDKGIPERSAEDW